MSRFYNDGLSASDISGGGNFLAHHGILGMKWGKRNGPPYPLAPGDHSAAEKKAAALNRGNGNLLRDWATIAAHPVTASRIEMERTANLIRAQKAKPSTAELRVNFDGKADQYKKEYEKIKNISKTDEEKDRRIKELDIKRELEYTKETGMYKLSFLEAIQNTELLHHPEAKGYEKQMLKEYKEYLEDPEEYWKHGRNKLPEE